MYIENRKRIDKIYLYLSWFMASVFVVRLLSPDFLNSNPDVFRGLDISAGSSIKAAAEAIIVLFGAVCVSVKERLTRDIKLILIGNFIAIFLLGWFYVSGSFGIAFGVFCKAMVFSVPKSDTPNKSSHSPT